MDEGEEKVSRADFQYVPKVKSLIEVGARIRTKEDRELVASILKNYAN